MKPILAITMGRPAGIGPEIVVRALSHKETYEKCRPIVTGDAAVMEEAVKLLGFDFKINAVDKVSDAKFEYGTIDVFDLHCVDMSTFKFGEVQPQCGNAAFVSIKKPSSLQWPTKLTELSQHRSTKRLLTLPVTTTTATRNSMQLSPIPKSMP